MMMLTNSLRIARTALVRQQRRRALTIVIYASQQHAASPNSRVGSAPLTTNNDSHPSHHQSIHFFHTSLPQCQKEKEEDKQEPPSPSATAEASVSPPANNSNDTTTAEEEPVMVQYSTPELTRDAALHKAAMEDPERPDWQNPLVHATGQTADGGNLNQVYAEDFDTPKEFEAAVLPAPPLATNPEEEAIPPAPEYLDALAEEIVHLTVLEMNELKNKMAQHYGFHEGMLSPDDVDLVDGDDGADDAEAGSAAAEEQKTAFDVKLTGFDAKAKIKVIKEVRAMAGLGLKEAKELVEGAPTTILKDVKQEQADEIKGKLEELGATVEIV